MRFALFVLAGVLALTLCAAYEPAKSLRYPYGDEYTTSYHQHYPTTEYDDDSIEGVPSLYDVIKSNVGGYFSHLSHAGKNFAYSLGSVKDTIFGKLTDLYNRLHQQYSGEYGIEKQEIKIGSRYLYRLPQTYDVEEAASNFLISDLEFKHVGVRNMHFNGSKLVVDYKNQKGVLYLYADRMTVSGKYWKNNFAASSNGDFQIELYNGVTYMENFEFNRYKLDADHTYEIRSYQSPHFEYGKMDHMYQNIGFISKSMEVPISKKLLEQLAVKMSAKIHYELEPIMKEKIEHYAHCGPVEEGIRQLVLKTVEDLREEWVRNVFTQVELPPSFKSPQEVTSGLYVAIMSNMYLTGLQNYQVEEVDTRQQDGKFGFRVHLVVKNVQGSLIVSIKHGENENEYMSMKKLHLPFTVDEIHAYLYFVKTVDDKESAFEPRAVHVKVVDAKYYDNTGIKYEEETRSLIQGELQSYLPNVINDRLQTRIEQAMTTYLYRGVLPPQ